MTNKKVAISCTENLDTMIILSIYVQGASDKLTDWLLNCSVSWPNRNPAVPFCHWFRPLDVPPSAPQEVELMF